MERPPTRTMAALSFGLSWKPHTGKHPRPTFETLRDASLRLSLCVSLNTPLCDIIPHPLVRSNLVHQTVIGDRTAVCLPRQGRMSKEPQPPEAVVAGDDDDSLLVTGSTFRNFGAIVRIPVVCSITR